MFIGNFKIYTIENKIYVKRISSPCITSVIIDKPFVNLEDAIQFCMNNR